MKRLIILGEPGLFKIVGAAQRSNEIDKLGGYCDMFGDYLMCVCVCVLPKLALFKWIQSI